jgi:hypothetical protein
MPKPTNMSKKILEDTMKHKDHIPLIRAFCNPGLGARHVEKLTFLLTLSDGSDIKDMNMKELN